MKSRGREGIVGVGGKIQTEARAGPLLRAVTTALPGLETKTEPKEPKGVTKRTERGVGPVHPGPEGAARCSLPGGPGPGGRRRLRARVLWPRVLWGGARPPARLTPKWTEVSCVWVCDAVGGQQGDPKVQGRAGAALSSCVPARPGVLLCSSGSAVLRPAPAWTETDSVCTPVSTPVSPQACLLWVCPLSSSTRLRVCLCASAPGPVV